MPPRRERTRSSKLRLKAIVRDQARCRNCGRRAPYIDLEVHHIVPVKAGGKEKLSNLATLCKPCHLDAEGFIRSLKGIGETDVAGQPYREMQKRLDDLRGEVQKIEDGKQRRESENAELSTSLEKALARLSEIEDRQAEQLPTFIPHRSETESRRRWEEWNEVDESTSKTGFTPRLVKIVSKLLS